jgi:release factor glutamine methyltransferase
VSNNTNQRMTTKKFLVQAVKKLEGAGISSARLDVLILLEDEMGKDRGYILAHPELVISQTKLNRLDVKLRRRAAHQPLAYIRGFSEFYSRKFYVNRHVLEPRPESETMIEIFKKLPMRKKLTVADIGTGSGALGITVALEKHLAEVDLFDIDSSVLAVARHNLHIHELNLKTYKRDLLSRAPRSYDVVLANLPYVPDRYKINQAAAMEPRLAIFGGSDGLDIYRRFFNQLHRLHRPPKYVLTESLPPQHSDLAAIAAKNDYKLAESEDFIQVFKLV